METENQDSSGNQPRNSDLLLQQIVEELAALKAASERKNKTVKRQTQLYSGIMALILGVCIFSIIQQGGRVRELESNQAQIKHTLQSIDGEIANELQRLDDLLNGELPQDSQDSILMERMFVENISQKINPQSPRPVTSTLNNRQYFFKFE